MFHSLSKTFDRLRVISPSHDLYDTGNASTSTPPLVFGSRKTILDRYSRSKTHLPKIKSCLPSLYLTPTRVYILQGVSRIVIVYLIVKVIQYLILLGVHLFLNNNVQLRRLLNNLRRTSA